MKFWQKLYLSTLSLFLIVFVSSILLVVHSIYENNLAMERVKGNRDAAWLAERLSKDFEELSDGRLPVSSDISGLLSSYSYDYAARNFLFSVYENRELLYTTLNFDDASLLPAEFSQDALSKVYWLEKQCFYCVCLPIPEQESYRVLYLHELTGFYPFMKDLSRICLTAGITGSILLAFLLYFLVKLLTRPLERLDLAAREIASGKYDTRVSVKGQDEFASVSQSFNNMAGEVSQHILSLERENQNKQMFIDNLAHEMRTPLTSIQGYGEYLKRGLLTEQERYEALAFITQQAGRLSSLGNQLLLLTNVRQGDFDFAPVAVSELIDTLKALFAERIQGKQISLTFTHTISCVTGESTLLESLASNLIENAIRACGQNGCIRVAFLDAQAGWLLRVEDNGIGIPKEALAFLTEPFYRTDKARSRANGGAGLGLTLCRQIALLHHGVLSVSSEEQAGTCITVTFTTS